MARQLNTQTAAASGGKMGNAIGLMGLQLNMQMAVVLGISTASH
jgi:hypothetical protein